MKASVLRSMAIAAFVAALAFGNFSRTPGADSVRPIQILSLMTSGAGLGVALALFLTRNRR